jgi:hypothetical protein
MHVGRRSQLLVEAGVDRQQGARGPDVAPVDGAEAPLPWRQRPGRDEDVLEPLRALLAMTAASASTSASSAGSSTCSNESRRRNVSSAASGLVQTTAKSAAGPPKSDWTTCPKGPTSTSTPGPSSALCSSWASWVSVESASRRPRSAGSVLAAGAAAGAGAAAAGAGAAGTSSSLGAAVATCPAGSAPSLRSTRAGMPPATTPGGISPETTLPAVITEPSPMVLPGRTVTRPAIQTSLPMRIGLGSSPCSPVASGTSVSARIEYCPTWLRSPMETSLRAWTTVPKLSQTSAPISMAPPLPATSSTLQ